MAATINAEHRRLSEDHARTQNWKRWVPHSSPDSNFGLARRLLFSRVRIPEQHIHAVDNSKRPDETARAYAAKIKRTMPVETGAFPRFDMVLLGLGEDGHTASLFPGHPALRESRRWVVPVFNAPKPPPVRLTMTLPVINTARQVAFVAAGSGKAGSVAEVFHPAAGRPDLPARMVKPTDGELHWFVDQAAAAVTNYKPIGDRSSLPGEEGSRSR